MKTMMAKNILMLLALGIALLANGARAQQAASAPLTVEERLSKLETEISALRQENQQLRAQTSGSGKDADTVAKSAISVRQIIRPDPAPGTVKPGASEQWISVGGFLMAQAEAGDAIDSRFSGLSSNDRIYLRRARIVLNGHFAENFDFKASAEMSGSLGGKSSMTASLADGYIAWTKFPAFNVTIGQFKSGFGYEFLCNDLAVYTIEHALVTDMLTLNRQIGAQVNGSLAALRTINYAFGIFNGTATNTNTNDNNQFLATARIAAVPVSTEIAYGCAAVWTIGANAYRTDDATVTLPDGILPSTAFAGRRTGLGVDTQLILGPCALSFEYLTTKYEPAAPASTKTTANGWYLMGAWNIVPKKLQAVVRYDTFDPNTSSTASRDKTDNWTLGVNYLIKGDDLKLMLNYMTSTPSYRNAATNTWQDSARANRVLLRVQAAF